MFAAFLTVTVRPSENRYASDDDIKITLPVYEVGYGELESAGIPGKIVDAIMSLNVVSPAITSARFVVGDRSVHVKVTTSNGYDD